MEKLLVRRCVSCNESFPDEIIFCPNDGELVIIGDILKETYKIEHKLGEGGMAMVFRATNILNNTVCAIKIIRPDMVVSEINAMERLLLEALKIKKINHPNIVKVIDYGPMHDGELVYLAMEFLAGKTLKKRIDEKGPLIYQRAFSIVEQVCAGIHAAHERGIVHRDLKSENIFLLANVKNNISIKIIDFGISSDDNNRFAWSKQIVGTPEYMSPEQCEGNKNVDGRSDVYSFGVTMYEMLTGVTPFPVSRWEPYEVMRKQMFEDPKPLSEIRPHISRKVERVVLKALEKNRDRRQQSMLELAEEFKNALIDDGIIEQVTNIVKFSIKDLSKSAFNQGITHLEHKEYEFAINCFNEAINYQSDHLKAFYYCGIAHQEMGNMEAAINNFNAAIDINPTYLEAYYQRGLCHQNNGSLDLAIEDFTQAAHLNKEHLKSYFHRGLIYKQQSKLDKAMEDFNAVIQLDEEHALAYYNLGLIHHYNHEIDQALFNYCKSIQFDSENVNTFVLRGFAYKIKGELDKAILDCNRALQIDANSANAYFVRSLVYLAKGALDLEQANHLTNSKHETDLSDNFILTLLSESIHAYGTRE